MPTTDAPLTIPAQDDLRIAPFEAAHLDGALRLSRDAGWPHRAEDWALTLSVSQGVVALSGDAVVGTALCSDFGQVATLNMIIVDAAMRGRGLGRALMERIIAPVDGRELRLVATSDGLPLYERLGFAACGEIVQHQGLARALPPEVAVTTGRASDADLLARMDLAASGMSRGALIAAIAEQGQVLCAARGFAVLRAFGRGQVLGPVVAQDGATARALMAEAARRCDGSFLRVDLPAETGLSAHAETLGLAVAGGGTAMRRTPRDRAPTEFTTYALVSQALG